MHESLGGLSEKEQSTSTANFRVPSSHTCLSRWEREGSETDLVQKKAQVPAVRLRPSDSAIAGLCLKPRPPPGDSALASTWTKKRATSLPSRLTPDRQAGRSRSRPCSQPDSSSFPSCPVGGTGGHVAPMEAPDWPTCLADKTNHPVKGAESQ